MSGGTVVFVGGVGVGVAGVPYRRFRVVKCAISNTRHLRACFYLPGFGSKGGNDPPAASLGLEKEL